MGGYIALEIMRQAASRVAKLALLDTGSRDDPPEAQERRRANIALAESGRFAEVIEALWPALVHPSRLGDGALKQIHVAMCHDVGPEAYVRQQKADERQARYKRASSRRHARMKLTVWLLLNDFNLKNVICLLGLAIFWS